MYSEGWCSMTLQDLYGCMCMVRECDHYMYNVHKTCVCVCRVNVVCLRVFS